VTSPTETTQFRDEAFRRTVEDLDKLGTAPSATLRFVVPRDFAAASKDDSVMVSLRTQRRKRGREMAPVTAAVIGAEAQRLFQARAGAAQSQSKVSQKFWPELLPGQRYAKYRTCVKDHPKKIQSRLSKLIGQ
jgi:hypothetical protein